MAFVSDPAGPVELGATRQQLSGFDGSGIPLHTRTIQHEQGGFCIDEAHFPGRGYPWPNAGGGSSLRIARALRDGLPRLNRRLCTYGEKLYASAGPDNWAFGHSPTDGAAVRCEFETRLRDGNGPERAIGGFPECTTKHSSWTLYDIDARATWVTRDPQSHAAMAQWWGDRLDPSPDVIILTAALSGLAIAPGGSNWVATTAGYHCHGADCGGNEGDDEDTSYYDDGFVLCADPHVIDPAVEERVRQAREAVARTGEYASLLDFL